MATISNVAVIRKMFDLLESGSSTDLDKIFAANWVNHDPSLPPMQGLEGAKQLIALWSGLTDRKVTVEDSVTDGDRVAIRFKLAGKQTAEFMGIAPTGRLVNVSGTGIFRVVDGKATDNWVNFDALGLLQQLGAVPMMPMPAK